MRGVGGGEKTLKKEKSRGLQLFRVFLLNFFQRSAQDGFQPKTSYGTVKTTIPVEYGAISYC